MLVYGLFDPADQTRLVRYVGCTAKTLDYRLGDHVRDGRRARTAASPRGQWLRMLAAAGRRPGIVELEEVTAKDWVKRERWWIATFGAQLLNGTAGGPGLVGPTDEVRARISVTVSATLKGNQRRCGVPHTAATRAKISAGLRRYSLLDPHPRRRLA
jgi:hypothetical protein